MRRERPPRGHNPGVTDVDRVERWFVRQGLPHFIEDYSASRDVLTRALPVLVPILLLELVWAFDLDLPLWKDALLVVAAWGVLALVLVTVNAVLGRPLRALPSRVRWPVLLPFVLAPAILRLAQGEAVSAITTGIGNLFLPSVVYLGTSYGVIPILRWAGVRLWRQLGDVFGLLARALPLLLLFVTFFFLAAEVWEVAAGLDGPRLIGVLGLFAGIGALFIGMRLPRELGQLGAFATWDEVVTLAADSPAGPLAMSIHAAADMRPALARRQWFNAGLVAFVSQALQALLVGALMALFFVVFGVLAVPEGIITNWTGAAPNPLEIYGLETPVTLELLRVAAVLGGFSSLYFAVVSLTDATYREEFREEVVGEMRRAFAVRAVYLAVRGGSTP